MKLLFVIQALDLDDPTLSVYHEWVAALAARCDSVVAICLKEGRHALPANVRVYSLGKEQGSVSGITYALRFLRLVWRLRHDYDRVFVHMNQEYILIAGWLWELMNKPVYLWRNHYAGSWLTDLAASTCTKVFCTSKHSYTAKYKKTVLMPVGVDTERFAISNINRVPHSILFLARMAPSKRPDILLDALKIIDSRDITYTADFYGDPLPEDMSYYDALVRRSTDRIRFFPGVPNQDTPEVYAAHDIFVNCSKSGMFDKTLFEGAASGSLVLAASDDFKDLAGEAYSFTDARTLAQRIEELFALSPHDRESAGTHMRSLARTESLATLADRLSVELGA